MSSSMVSTKILPTAGTLLLVILLFAAAAIWGGSIERIHVAGLFVLIGGEIALLLTGFSYSEIGAAIVHAFGSSGSIAELRRSAYFWEAAARNAILLGVLSTQVSVALLIGSMTGVEVLIQELGNTLLPLFYGVIAGVVSSLPALLLTNRIERQTVTKEFPSKESELSETGLCFENWLGYFLCAALIIWMLPSPSPVNNLDPIQLFVHWPALLVVAGGALLLYLFLRALGTGRSLTLSFAFAGVLGALVGLIQTSHGFAQGSISTIAGAISFAISSCFVAMVGMLFIGIPLQDRAQWRQGERPRMSRIAWYGLPLVTLSVLALSVILILTPIAK